MKYHATPNSDAAPLDAPPDAALVPPPEVANSAFDAALAARIADLLPQTQCTKCGYAGCQPYADAIASGQAGYNQCPPGGTEGVARLAHLLGRPVIPLNLEHGVERPRPLARIDESLCIGCTLCIQACPVDAIVGSAKQMHTVIDDWCTGCDLCVAPCPVDCIEMVPVTGHRTGWQAWSPAAAARARQRHANHEMRAVGARAASAARLRERDAIRRAQAAAQTQIQAAAPSTTDPAAAASTAPTLDEAARKRAVIEAALERARQKKAALTAAGLGPKNTDNVSPAVQAQIDAAERRRQGLSMSAGAEANAAAHSPAAPGNPGNPGNPGKDKPA